MPRDRLSFPSSPTSSASPRISPEKAAYLRAQQHQHAQLTLRSLTGSELYALSPPSSPLEKRYSRQHISLFRAATGEEKVLPLPLSPPSLPHSPAGFVTHENDDPRDCKPRISSVTDSTHTGSPDHTRADLPLAMDVLPSRCSLPESGCSPLKVSPPEDDVSSTYSHASAINLDDLDDDDLDGLLVRGLEDADSPPIIDMQTLENRRQSFANSFAKARQAKASQAKASQAKVCEAKDTRKAVVLAPRELQPHNKSATLIERCVRAFTEALDVNLIFAKVAAEKFTAFAALFTKDERQVIGELLREASARLRHEAPTPWRSPIHRSTKRALIRAVPATSQQSDNNSRLSAAIRGTWSKRNQNAMTNDTLVRSVVFGSHVIPGVQSAESILLRMAGEYQREEVNRKASRSERIDIPLSFAMTLSGALATFARLDCTASYRRYRSRSATNRRSNPQALIMLKTRYDGMKLSFAVTLHGEAPCTVLFRRPRIFSPRKIDDYATLVTEAKDILTEFGREVTGQKD